MKTKSKPGLRGQLDEQTKLVVKLDAENQRLTGHVADLEGTVDRLRQTQEQLELELTHAREQVDNLRHLKRFEAERSEGYKEGVDRTLHILVQALATLVRNT
jgi:predicted  nucleic acid-binding Zn-ribbon protein